MLAGMNLDRVEVRDSLIAGRGLFARAPIRAGERVLEYLGERITKEESLRRCEAGNPFIFSLDEHFDLDGAVEWNPARFANHSCTPNCETEDDEGRIWVVALRDIAPGEELTYNYNFDLAEFREHRCACRAENCVGFMVAEEHFPALRRLRENGALTV
jgi:SET domain-containing protein